MLNLQYGGLGSAFKNLNMLCSCLILVVNFFAPFKIVAKSYQIKHQREVGEERIDKVPFLE